MISLSLLSLFSSPSHRKIRPYKDDSAVHSYAVNVSNSITITEYINQGDRVSISSSAPCLAIVFHKMPPGNVTLYIEDQVYKQVYDTSRFFGVDFGTSIGKLTIFASYGFELSFSALVFPPGCNTNRLISTVYKDNISLLRKDGGITDKQEFCFWPANVGVQDITISGNTEAGCDILSANYGGNSYDYSGFFSHSLISTDSNTFFTWTTDISVTSEYISIIVKNREQPSGPLIRQSINGTMGHSIIIMDQGDANGFDTDTSDENQNIWGQIIPPIIGVVLSVMVVFCLYLGARIVAKIPKRDQLTEVLNDNSQYLQTKCTEQLPLPITSDDIETGQKAATP